ncbi:hypothetical protein MSG28_006654 [Choristoneura fumiferana]|uniref:Uncharacterized protein n=1 Tax=Choristoneura fumiferana TaxID=7141 RepID=A0ACC0JKP8_CHOFU|nr:hypothetical protein MSG28_006654 [Choristoneura fumiferana]
MLLALVLVAHARAEWVEITQLHKPSRIIHKPSLPVPTTERYSEKITHTQFWTEPAEILHENKNRIYFNNSLEQRKLWSKGVVHRVPILKRTFSTTEEPARSKYEETDLSIEFPNGYTKRNPFKAFTEQIPEFVTKEETFEDDEIEELHYVRKPPEETWAPKKETPIKSSANKSVKPDRRVDTEEIEPVVIKKHEILNSKGQHDKLPTENYAKDNTMENVLKFVKVVADTITRNTRKSFNSKLRYLEDLKDTIMVNIEDRIESLYPDDSGPGGSAARRRRWARSAEARGHVEFPSSESALMTISFLTFAVYLIKLVLQVIHTYKNKTMMVAPAVVAMGRAASGILQTSNAKNSVN